MAVRSDAARPKAEFLLEHLQFVVSLCRILLRDADESEDAAQQVFLNAYRAVGDGVRPLNVRAWLAQIARNECRSRVRRAAAHPEAPLPEALPADGPDPADAAAQHALVARLRHELAELPDRQREAVLLREFRGLSYEELAAAMNETRPAVESLLQRGRRRLTKRLEEARRPFVGAALSFEWIRNAVAKLLPTPAPAEAVTTGGTAAVVATLAAAGVVAVSVGVAGREEHPTPRADSPPIAGRMVPAPASTSSFRVPSRHRPARTLAAPSKRGGVPEQASRPARRGSDDVRSDEAPAGSPTGGTPSASSGDGSSSSGSGSSGSGSSGSGSSGSGSSGSGSSGSGSGDSGSSSSEPSHSGSGSDSPSSGPGSGPEELSSSGPSDHSGSDGSGSSGSGSSGSGSSGSGD